MNFNSTVKGSMLEGFYPAGWDFDKIDACIDAPEKVLVPQCFWNRNSNARNAAAASSLPPAATRSPRSGGCRNSDRCWYLKERR